MNAIDFRVGGWRAARIVGVPYRTLDSWVRTRLLTCEVPAQGKGTRRGFGLIDLVRARAVAEMRKEGASLQAIRQVVAELTDHYAVTDPLALGRLLVAGSELFWDIDDATLLNVVKQQLAARPLILLDVGEIVVHVRRELAKLAA